MRYKVLFNRLLDKLSRQMEDQQRHSRRQGASQAAHSQHNQSSPVQGLYENNSSETIFC